MEKMTVEELRALQTAATKGTKRVQGAERVELEGITFDSKREARRYAELRMLERGGHISDLKLQVKMPLNGRQGPILTPTGRQAYYRADFTYIDNSLGGAFVVEDAKGFATEIFTLKAAILKADGIEVIEV